MTSNTNCYHVIKLFHFMYSIRFQVVDLDFPDLNTYLFFKQKLKQIYKKRQRSLVSAKGILFLKKCDGRTKGPCLASTVRIRLV